MGKSEIRWDKSITGDLPNSDELQTEIATDLILFCTVIVKIVVSKSCFFGYMFHLGWQMLP